VNDFLFARKLEPDVVIMLNLQVVGRLKRMNNLLLAVGSCDDSLSLRSKRNDRDSISVHHDVLLVSIDEERSDLRLPKLERLMLVEWPWSFS
jgi:hypothetical protein